MTLRPMMAVRRRAIYCAVALLSCAMLPAPPARSAPAAAPAAVCAATDDLAARVCALAQPAIDDGRVAGMVIGVVDKKGATRLFGFGRISRADPRPPDGKTVFEIGSVSKVFTTTLLADLVERKVVALDDPIKKYLPPTVKVPSHGSRRTPSPGRGAGRRGIAPSTRTCAPGRSHWGCTTATPARTWAVGITTEGSPTDQCRVR